MLTIENVRIIKYGFTRKVIASIKKILQVDEKGNISCVCIQERPDYENKSFRMVHEEEVIAIKHTDFSDVFFFKPDLLSKGMIAFRDSEGQAINLKTSYGESFSMCFQITKKEKDIMYKIYDVLRPLVKCTSRTDFLE